MTEKFRAASDHDWLTLACAEGAKGIGRTAPNPPVGAVIARDGVLLGAGWHRAAGQPHAEPEAIANARQNGHADLSGATMYVTLEPCSSHGRTPPCTAAILASGVTRVVYAEQDPDPRHRGAAAEILRAGGLDVRAGVPNAAAAELILPFAKVRRTGLPWVVWKSAMSLDGRISRRPGESQWLSSPASRAEVQRLRSHADAILTSGETTRVDHPALTIRDPKLLRGREQPWRIVMTRFPDQIPREAPLFRDAHAHRTLLFPYENPAETLRHLATELGVLSVLVEAGGRLSGHLLAAGLIDEALVFLCPMITGGTRLAMGEANLSAPLDLEHARFTRIGDDILCRTRISPRAAST